jgi:hypothetical protein
MKALQRLHAPAAIVTRERIWIQLYIRRVDLAEAAKLAERKILEHSAARVDQEEAMINLEGTRNVSIGGNVYHVKVWRKSEGAWVANGRERG